MGDGMKTYEVYFTESVVHYHYKIVEADSKEQAVKIANEDDSWTTYQMDSVSKATKTKAKLAKQEDYE